MFALNLMPFQNKQFVKTLIKQQRKDIIILPECTAQLIYIQEKSSSSLGPDCRFRDFPQPPKTKAKLKPQTSPDTFPIPSSPTIPPFDAV